MPNKQEVQLALLAAAGKQADDICADTRCSECPYDDAICTSLLNLNTGEIRLEWFHKYGRQDEQMDQIVDRLEEATEAILAGVQPKDVKEPDSGTHLGSERLPEPFVWVIAIIQETPHPRVVVGYRNTNCEGDYLSVHGEPQIWWFRIMHWRYLHEAWPDKFDDHGGIKNASD